MNVRTAMSAIVMITGMAGAGSVPAADAAAKGELWQTTSQMSMPGMPMQMPATTVKACLAKDSKEPPGAPPGRGTCKNLNYKREGNKVTWITQCTGPEMTGTGQIVYSGNSYSGVISMMSADGSMSIKLSGQKIGECDNPKQ
jgi:hypothetical protein